MSETFKIGMSRLELKNYITYLQGEILNDTFSDDIECLKSLLDIVNQAQSADSLWDWYALLDFDSLVMVIENFIECKEDDIGIARACKALLNENKWQ